MLKYFSACLFFASIIIAGSLAVELSAFDAKSAELLENTVDRGYYSQCCTQYCYWKEICETPTPTPTPYYYYYSYERTAQNKEVAQRNLAKEENVVEKDNVERGYFPTYYYYAPPTYYYYEYYTPTPTPYCTYTQICQEICE
eukprot:jgi/Galph1/5801/GphlegSOOS_G4456.1